MKDTVIQYLIDLSNNAELMLESKLKAAGISFILLPLSNFTSEFINRVALDEFEYTIHDAENRKRTYTISFSDEEALIQVSEG